MKRVIRRSAQRVCVLLVLASGALAGQSSDTPLSGLPQQQSPALKNAEAPPQPGTDQGFDQPFSGEDSFSEQGFGELEALDELDALDELLQTEVSTLLRGSSDVRSATSAISQISRDRILRSGLARSPEALRLVPGFQVSRLATNRWSITARGFGANFSNKLLVMRDGRPMYSRFFGGVLWGSGDPAVQDLERIEAIRGPGSVFWGSNAVNGVVNFVTRDAFETQGGLLDLRYGNTDEAPDLYARYGGTLGEDSAWRVSARAFAQDGMLQADGSPAFNDTAGVRLGARLDQRGAHLDWTADFEIAYTEGEDSAFEGRNDGSISRLVESVDKGMEGFLRVRLGTPKEERSDGAWDLQLSYGHLDIDLPWGRYRDGRYHLDFQHEWKASESFTLLSGLQYELSRQRTLAGRTLSFEDESANVQIASAFAHGRIHLLDKALKLEAGARLEHNDFTGFEVQPTLRGSYRWHSTFSTWFALTRSLRLPSRVEDSGRFFFGPSSPHPPVSHRCCSRRWAEATTKPRPNAPRKSGSAGSPPTIYSWKPTPSSAASTS